MSQEVTFKDCTFTGIAAGIQLGSGRRVDTRVHTRNPHRRARWASLMETDRYRNFYAHDKDGSITQYRNGRKVKLLEEE